MSIKGTKQAAIKRGIRSRKRAIRQKEMKRIAKIHKRRPLKKRKLNITTKPVKATKTEKQSIGSLIKKVFK